VPGPKEPASVRGGSGHIKRADGLRLALGHASIIFARISEAFVQNVFILNAEFAPPT